jgi:hypothetical protein
MIEEAILAHLLRAGQSQTAIEIRRAVKESVGIRYWNEASERVLPVLSVLQKDKVLRYNQAHILRAKPRFDFTKPRGGRHRYARHMSTYRLTAYGLLYVEGIFRTNKVCNA